MLKNIFTLIIILSFTLFSAQDSIDVAKNITKDTKFGLVLSGGGAKGFAHIGILKIIDSLGIKIDFITGTSMGGILGGLYAMGYSGKDLKKTVYSTNWKRVLSNTIPYNKVNISEKDEYEKYIIEFPVSGIQPMLPSSLIEGQYMSEVLNTLTFKAKHINDFNKLNIPVQLTSSDIVNGGLVMQKKGSLALAIRATLAIPAVFAPVYIGDRLFVDGGLDRNFPVQEVKDMGADFIIGGYAGFRLFTKKEIENPIKMIYQTHAFRSVEDYKSQKKLSKILVDFVGPLNDYTTKDFKFYKEIIDIGEREAHKYLPQFVAIANRQRELGIIYHHQLTKEIKKSTIGFTYSNENGIPLNEHEVKAIKELMGLKEGNYYDVQTVNESIDKIFGMRRYEKVYYTYTDSDDGLVMNIFIKPLKQSALKLALHYDNEQSVGIIVNYTYRNIKSNFRTLSTIDISERFKARFQFQKFFGNNFRWWIDTEVSTLHTKSIDYYLRFINEFENNQSYISDYAYKYTNVNTAINYTLSTNAFSSLGIEYTVGEINRSFDKIQQILWGNNAKNVYKHSSFDVFVKLNQNNLNKRYYPSSGNQLLLKFKYHFGNQYNLYDLENSNPSLYNYLNPRDWNYFIPKNLFSLMLNENYIYQISNKLSIRSDVFLGAHFSSDPKSPEKIPHLFFDQKFNIGGSEYDFNGVSPTFNGFRQKELPASSFFKLGFDLQYNFYRKFYVTPSFHYGSGSNELNPFVENDILYGYGAGFGYESVLGPINLYISKNNFIDFWRIYFSIGFKF